MSARNPTDCATPAGIGGGHNDVIADYRAAKREARKWARIALQARSAGEDYSRAAGHAHAAMQWALFII